MSCLKHIRIQQVVAIDLVKPRVLLFTFNKHLIILTQCNKDRGLLTKRTADMIQKAIEYLISLKISR